MGEKGIDLNCLFYFAKAAELFSVSDHRPIRYEISPSVTDDSLNNLFEAAWENYQSRPFQPILSRSLLYVCAL